VTLDEQLILHEGLRLTTYRCTAGKLTIGVGYNIDDRGLEELERVIGHPFTGTLTREEAVAVLMADLATTEQQLAARLPWFSTLDRCRQWVLIDMAFNMGVPGLLKFTRTLASVRQGLYAQAAEQMLQSKWATQVKQRAERLATMMRTGC
jgi:lysozyme